MRTKVRWDRIDDLGPKREAGVRCRFQLSRSELAELRLRDPDCAICHKEGPLGIDHNHNTKVVRGRLCQGCNIKMIGLDDAEWLDAAQRYLKDRDLMQVVRNQEVKTAWQ